MEKQTITDKQGIFLIVSFMFGSLLVSGTVGKADKDSWIALIVSAIIFLPLLLVYIRMMSLYPGNDLFDISYKVFGKVGGNIVNVLYILFFMQSGASYIRIFTEFIETVALTSTPVFVPILSLTIVCIISVKLGLEVIARFTTLLLPMAILLLFIINLMIIPMMKHENLLPLFNTDIKDFVNASFISLIFPFAEILVFTGILSDLKTRKSTKKVFLWGTIISVFFIVFIAIRNIAVLGNMTNAFIFQSYEAVSLINIGNFFQRLEITVSFVFIFGTVIKCSVCLLFVCKGIAKIFKIKDYRYVVFQIGALYALLSYFYYEELIKMINWHYSPYPFFATPFLIILPLLTWIISEIKAKRNKLIQASG